MVAFSQRQCCAERTFKWRELEMLPVQEAIVNAVMMLLLLFAGSLLVQVKLAICSSEIVVEVEV